MKKGFILFLLIGFRLGVNAQGLVFDSADFNEQIPLEVTRSELPDSYSLESYMPILYPQTGGTCVAMSFALARTLMLAMELNATDEKTATSCLMSPYYIYYLCRDKYDYSCDKGLNPVVVAKKSIGLRLCPDRLR